eukprot:TRINITY_DN2750_c0_g1_i2.p3 TRINITY_DN2750_c0_g1~~TRINITY_DN2750_c0_g1_i2.p3  ORF type:complete len:127 (-),score=6.88 TRINITY_DN2750_c0_g1_i2:369-749(-)
MQRHLPAAEHSIDVMLPEVAHVPHVPPHPSLPHSRPLQFGVQLQLAEESQPWSRPQTPHVPPHPSSPHVLFLQSGMHKHCPVLSQISWLPWRQKPQAFPHPSSPHCLPVQSPTHRSHIPSRQISSG